MSLDGDATLLVPTPPGRSSGRPEHYYHFVFDLLLAIHRSVSSLEPESRLAVCADFPAAQAVVPRLFSNRVSLRASADGVEAVPMPGLDPNHVRVSPRLVDGFVDHVLATCSSETPDVAPYVVFIRRGEPDAHLVSLGRTSGSQRRSFRNHDALVAVARDVLEVDVVDVELESLPFGAQVDLFRRASGVIGQHGAGLTNILWSRERTTVLELGEPGYPHFWRIARLRRLRYRWMRVPGRICDVDPVVFADALRCTFSPHPVLRAGGPHD